MKRSIALFLVLLLAGCSISQNSAQVINFKIAENNLPVEGSVYQNGTFLGFATNGEIKLNSSLSPGPLRFAGWYHGKPFNVTFSLSSDSAYSKALDLSINKDQLESMTFKFRIQETMQPIDGEVFDNDKSLGRTENGQITVAASDIEPGKIRIKGRYHGKEYEYFFELQENDMTLRQMNFNVAQKEFDAALFDSSELNRREIEREVIDAINKERAKAGTPLLKLNELVADVARAHSTDMAANAYFAHKDRDGKHAGDRLKKEQVFYTVAAEDLSLMENVDTTTNISKEAVTGWMASPGHRSPIVDVDHLYSDAGAGLACNQRTCYVTLVFIGNEKIQGVKLSPSYVTFQYVYDPGLGFSFPVPIGINVTSASPITVYIVSDRSQYNQIIQGQSVEPIAEYKDTTSVYQEFTASPQMGIILENDGSDETQVSISLDYYP